MYGVIRKSCPLYFHRGVRPRRTKRVRIFVAPGIKQICVLIKAFSSMVEAFLMSTGLPPLLSEALQITQLKSPPNTRFSLSYLLSRFFESPLRNTTCWFASFGALTSIIFVLSITISAKIYLPFSKLKLAI